VNLFSFAAEPANSPPPSSTISAPLSMSRQVRDASAVGRSRASDPATSHAAARKAARFAASHAGRILAALQQGPATAHELERRTGLTVPQIDRRMTELADAGKVCLVLFMGEPLVRGGARVWEAV
jgi:DNA-binding transcriptional ArsR family regulator